MEEEDDEQEEEDDGDDDYFADSTSTALHLRDQKSTISVFPIYFINNNSEKRCIIDF